MRSPASTEGEEGGGGGGGGGGDGDLGAEAPIGGDSTAARLASAASGAATTTATETDGRGRNPRMHMSTAPGSARSGDRASARSDGERFVSVGDASDAPNASRTATDRRGREARDDTRASRRGISCARYRREATRPARASRLRSPRRNAAALAIGKRRDAEARNLSKKFSNFQTANAVERRTRVRR